MGSITDWIRGVEVADQLAAQRLWERYFQRLVHLARRRLGDSLRTMADEEDVAISAFESFCARVSRGGCPNLSDRDDLWRLLVVITARKAVDQIQREGRKKRGGGKVVKGSALGASPDGGLDAIIGKEPTPEFAASVAEEFRGLLASLGDEELRRLAVWKMEGYTNAEITEKLGCAPRTVARKLGVIRSRLKRNPET
jgi:DNA-directed RNA polymerase specialized sigma24 family protein